MCSELSIPIHGGNVAEFHEQTARDMARVFQARVAEMSRLMVRMDECGDEMSSILDPDNTTYNGFRVSFGYSHDYRYSSTSRDEIFDKMKRHAWRIIFNRLGLRNIMSVKRREEFEKQLESGDVPEITEDTIVSVIKGMAGQAKDFAKEAAREVFDLLRPNGSYHKSYKTNSVFRVGKRVILGWMVEHGYGKGKFRVSYRKEQLTTAIDAVFHLLDGKGIMREDRGPLYQAINASETGSGETEYFKFRGFKNGNLHLTFKRLDLVKQLNGLAVGEFVLGKSE